MRRVVLAVLLALTAVAAFGQGTVQQSGPVALGHPSVWFYNGLIGDPGGANGYAPNGSVGAGISELLMVEQGNGAAPVANAGSGPLGTNGCDYDAPVTSPTGYHVLCFGPNAQGGALIYYNAFGGAPQLPLQFYINGSFYQFPPVGTGSFACAPRAAPPAPTSGFIIYCDQSSGAMAAISSNGNITELALP